MPFFSENGGIEEGAIDLNEAEAVLRCRLLGSWAIKDQKIYAMSKKIQRLTSFSCVVAAISPSRAFWPAMICLLGGMDHVIKV